MTKTPVVSLILIIANVVLGASLQERINSVNAKSADTAVPKNGHNSKTHEAMIEVFGRPRPSMDLDFGNNPAIEQSGNSNVKTTRRRYAIPQNTAGREPSIQAYGLPKRRFELENNGHIERVSFDRATGLDGKVEKVNLQSHEAGIQAFGLRKKVEEDNGFIERVGHEEESAPVPGKDASSPKSWANVRSVRSVDAGSDKNDLVDLEAQEAKVFRPLFVYRQQVADRYRLKGKKNAIYGAYQYGADKRSNSNYYYPKRY